MRAAQWLAVCSGVVLGLGAFTFQYAQGLSYFSNRPENCANCHIMRDQLDSWQKSVHHGRATCNDCHTPHDPLGKLVTKADNGWRHSSAFTLQNFPDPIRITPRNRARLLHNCVGCHGGLVAEIEHASVPHGSGELDCLHCHAGVGHGPRY